MFALGTVEPVHMSGRSEVAKIKQQAPGSEIRDLRLWMLQASHR